MSSKGPGIYSPDFKAVSIEKAVLLEDIVLPDLPPFPSHEDIKAGNVYYPRPEELYEDTVGKFSIPILTPLSDNNGAPVDTNVNDTIRNVVNNDCFLTYSTYQSSNYLELVIPKYILLEFLSRVPAGTEFIVAFIGGETDTTEIKVLGLG